MLSTACHALAFPEPLEWYESCTLLGRVEKIVTASFSGFCGPDQEPWLRKASSQLIEDSEMPRIQGDLPKVTQPEPTLSHNSTVSPLALLRFREHRGSSDPKR